MKCLVRGGCQFGGCNQVTTESKAIKSVFNEWLGQIKYIYKTKIPVKFVCFIFSQRYLRQIKSCYLKVARYSFPGPIPPMFEHKLRSHKQSFEKIATTVVLDKDENLL